MREVEVHLLAAGSCRHPEAMTRSTASWRPADFPALPALLVHPVEGPIMFDTGYSPSFTAATDPFPERLYRWLTPMQLSAGNDAAARCRALGFDPHDVRHVVVSHFHADHVAGLHAFSAARIHCARSGLSAAMRGGRLRSVCGGILRGLLPDDIASRACFFEEASVVDLPRTMHPFSRAADVLGDGSLLAVELPGHCPGHWGLLVADALKGPHFLVADAAWSSESIRRNLPPPRLTTAFLGTTDATRRTLAALHELAGRNPDVLLTPYHCSERAAATAGS